MLPTPPARADTAPLPAVGIGLREPHVERVLALLGAGEDDALGPVSWLEVHTENYLWAGPQRAEALRSVAREIPLSLHGVGMSLGSADGLSRRHLAATGDLARDLAPCRISEHACWSAFEGRHFHDLLPLPLNRAAADVLVENIHQAQEVLGRALVIENLSSYLALAASEMTEWEFLRDVCQRSGAALLLDVNNVWVSAANLGFDPLAYLDGLRGVPIAEIHLAGHTRKAIAGREVLIDDHGGPVCASVWALYRETLERFGPIPTLIEWDRDLPDLSVLVAEAAQAVEVAATRRTAPDDLAA